MIGLGQLLEIIVPPWQSERFGILAALIERGPLP
jgi:hypothetical protein